MMEDLRELVITLTWAMALLIIGFDSDVRWLDRHAPRLSFLDPRLLEAAMSEGVAATNIPRAIMDDPDRLRARRSVLFRRFMTSWAQEILPSVRRRVEQLIQRTEAHLEAMPLRYRDEDQHFAACGSALKPKTPVVITSYTSWEP